MQKIISLYQRNYDGDRLVRDEVVPGTLWVLAGEGIATRKFDGTACRFHNDTLYKRYDVKKGRQKPEGFVAAQEPDATTGHWPGWVPVGDGPEDKWHRAAFRDDLDEGTYELVGPKIQSNPEGYEEHTLILHGIDPLLDAPREFEALRQYFSEHDIEGIVWHHPDGRMVKIKGKDFGLKRS